MNKYNVGEGKVSLIAGGGKVYTDIATRFIKSEKSLDEIIASPYSAELVRKIVDSGHKAAVEFDFFIFGIEGYSRVTEVQLVRKRLASYMIKTGRANKSGKRSFDMVIPKGIEKLSTTYQIPISRLSMPNGESLAQFIPYSIQYLNFNYDSNTILNLIENWYNTGIENGLPEEDLRYLKPQATEFKAIIGMNAHALMDWFTIRCCKNAQTEIRDLANKMLKICKDTVPDLFKDAGASCKVLGYCPENEMQHESCKGKVLSKREALEILKGVK